MDEADGYFSNSILSLAMEGVEKKEPNFFSMDEADEDFYNSILSFATEGVVETEEPNSSTVEAERDFHNSILSRFGNPTNEHHQHLRTVIGAISRELREQYIPSTPVAYFSAACFTLDRLVTSEPADSPQHMMVDALVAIFSVAMENVPIALLKKKWEFLARLLLQVFSSPSSMAETSSVVAGLKCVSHLLIHRDNLVSWSDDVSQLFSLLLGFVTDSRPEVRRQSHLCLRDTLLSIQKSPLLPFASEGMANTFERFLLLAGGANANSGEGSKGAQQVLYILDALKECLPLMSVKYKTSILRYFKTLLDLHQPVVTRRIMDSLSSICLYPESEVSPEVLLELLSSLALSVSTNEMSGDGMAFTSRLLDVGMNKIFSLNRQICVIKLPVVFNALKHVLASEHEEAIYAAMDALKSLIHSCIDDSLIKQGVDQITLNANTVSRKSGPTLIEKICATIESLLDYHYTPFWDRVFQVASTMFLKLDRKMIFLYLQSLVGEMASISDREVICGHFRSTILELRKVTQKACEADNTDNLSSMEVDELSNNASLSVVRAKLLHIAVSMLPGLNSEEINQLYVEIMSTLQDAEGVIQKKGYKVLSMMLRERNEFISLKFEELLGYMIKALPSCHIAAKHHRLNCLYFLIVHVSKDNQEQRWRVVDSFLTEIVLALKEANKKTRNRAYDILVKIGHALGDEERGGNRENLYQFFNKIASGLAGETPHMISAAAKGLARLAYEFPDLMSPLYNLLPSTVLLLQRENREIIKASLGLLKVLVAKSQVQWLQLSLGFMVEGLMNSQDGTKNHHFKAKVKLLLEMLVRKCGVEAVRAVMPEEHMKLPTNICKIMERKERKQQHLHLKSAISSSRSKILPKHLSGQSDDDEPLDLLDRLKTRSALRSSSEHLKRKPSIDDEVEVEDSEGRLIIREEEGGQKKVENNVDDPRSEADGHLCGKFGTRLPKRKKTSDSGWAYTGSEYGSKKGSGDVKKKDKLEPYAYWPLDRKMMSRRARHRTAARKGMASVVKMKKNKLKARVHLTKIGPRNRKFK